MTDAAPSTRLTLAHRLWRHLPQAPRRAALAWAGAIGAPRPDAIPPAAAPGLAVAGEIGRASGLGEGARLMLAALDRFGVPAYPLAEGDRSESAPPAAVPLVIHVNAPHIAAALRRLPPGCARGRRIIGYWAWELPVVPPLWRIGTRFVHEVWVPSRFTAAALETLMPGRVRVVPHPVALAPHRPSVLGRLDFGFPDGVIVVLVSFSLASSFERKNPLGAIAAFGAAFGDRADRLLVIRVSHAQDFPADLARLQRACAPHRNIRIDDGVLPIADHHAMVNCADIILSLHRSEGFGLVPAEAMLAGRPVIATGWSGNMDFMDAHTAALVGYRLIAARDPRGVFEAPGAVWADPDTSEAAGHLQRLADDAGLRAQLGAAGAQHVRTRLDGQELREAIADLGEAAA